jgi:hypothetical protein
MVVENQENRVWRAPLIFTVPAYGFVVRLLAVCGMSLEDNPPNAGRIVQTQKRTDLSGRISKSVS